MGYKAEDELSKLASLLKKECLYSRIIAGSVREPRNVVDWLLAGADIVTVVPAILDKMLVHPYTSLTVQQFLDDAKVLN
jgi:transaldolase